MVLQSFFSFSCLSLPEQNRRFCLLVSQLPEGRENTVITSPGKQGRKTGGEYDGRHLTEPCVSDSLLETLAEMLFTSSPSLSVRCKEVVQCHLPTGIAWQGRNSWSRPLVCVNYNKIPMLYKKFESRGCWLTLFSCASPTLQSWSLIAGIAPEELHHYGF